MTNHIIQHIAQQITVNPSQWVLVVGDDVSYTKPNAPHAILKLVYQYKTELSKKPGFYQYIFEENSKELAEILFGNVWNGVSFLNKESKIQMNLRAEYAKGFFKKEEINFNSINNLLRTALPLFHGTILTFCRDETIEALLEYEKSLFVNEIVWTPYDMLTSPRWKKWEESTKIEDDLSELFEPIFTDMHMLLKLNGSCRSPYQMPLSSNDYELYYPTSNDEDPCTKIFIHKIFDQKNLIFLGFDSYIAKAASSDVKSSDAFAPGISDLLSCTKSKNERYLVSETGYVENNFWDDYGMTLIEKDDFEKIIKIAKEKPCDDGSGENNEIQQHSPKNNQPLSSDRAKDLFWHYYVRRQKDLISENEKYILEQILNNHSSEESESNAEWDKSGIILLSMIANKQADFYNLKKMIDYSKNAFSSEDNTDPIFHQKNMLWHLLFDKLSDQSKNLLLILKHYNSGFPVSFLQLLSENENELESWKKAGFQLANSGIYIRRHYRKNLYKRMEYADSLLLTAGEDSAKKQFPMANAINKAEHQLDDSYFYPSDDRIITNDLLSGLSTAKIEENYYKLLKNLQKVLEDKREGYHHIRSLLETEFRAIICTIQEFYNANQDYITKLLYYLLLESRGIPKNIGELETILTKKDMNISTIQSASVKDKEKSVRDKAAILFIRAMVKSYSSDLSEQNEAIKLCEKAESIFENLENDLKTTNTLISKETFDQRIQTYFLKSRIFERVHLLEASNGNTEKKKSLTNMHQTLEEIGKQLTGRTSRTHNNYAELETQLNHWFGKYFYHMNQYYITFDKSTQKYTNSYNKSAGKLEDALKYYQKYPHRYLIQRADVMRDIADLYIHGSKFPNTENEHEDGYALLAKAYEIYRKNADLYGIADVLLSVGRAEYSSELHNPSSKRRSFLCFYKTAKDIYHHLGDNWKDKVVSNYSQQMV